MNNLIALPLLLVSLNLPAISFADTGPIRSEQAMTASAQVSLTMSGVLTSYTATLVYFSVQGDIAPTDVIGLPPGGSFTSAYLVLNEMPPIPPAPTEIVPPTLPSPPLFIELDPASVQMDDQGVRLQTDSCAATPTSTDVGCGLISLSWQHNGNYSTRSKSEEFTTYRDPMQGKVTTRSHSKSTNDSSTVSGSFWGEAVNDDYGFDWRNASSVTLVGNGKR